MALQIILLYVFISLSMLLSFFYLLVLIDRTALRFKALKNFPKVTFVIPAFNAEKYIEKAITAIFDSDYPKKQIKVIVVNDGSTDRTLEILKELKKKYSLTVCSKKNEGKKAYALNFGIKKVKTPYTIVLDADTIMSPSLLKKSIERFADPKIMAVTSKMIPDSRKKFFERMQFVEYAFTSYQRDIMHAANSLQTTPAYSAFRTEFFKKYGLFDPDNLCEDFEMGLRIQKYHYDIGFVTDAYAETYVPSRFSDLLNQRVRWGYGVFYNLFKYRRLFHPAYGDFGIFFLPSTLFGIFVLLGAITLAGYNVFSSAIDFVHHWALGWRPNFFDTSFFDIIISISELKIILSVFIFLIAILLFFIVKQNTKEVTFIDYLWYMFVYNWLLAYFYIVVIFRFIFRIKSKW